MKLLSLTGILFCFIFSGCASSAPQDGYKQLMKSYVSDVKKYDGVSQEEAILIAKSQVVFHGYEKQYYIDRPEIFLNDASSWGVRFYPIHKALSEVSSKPTVAVFIDKKDGTTRWKKEFLEK